MKHSRVGLAARPVPGRESRRRTTRLPLSVENLMRVLFAVHGFPPRAVGGTETYAQALARSLRRAGDEMTILAREADPSRREHAIRREGIDGLELIWFNNAFRRRRTR